jgi:hypothetical protein
VEAESPRRIRPGNSEVNPLKRTEFNCGKPRIHRHFSVFQLKTEAVGGIQLGMLTDSIPAQPGSSANAARERIRQGPLPDWVVPCSFAPDFKPGLSGQVTHLLCDKQLHAEKHQEYTHVAIRLETIQAVQQESEWRIEIEPRHQQVTVHFIKVHRAGKQFDQTRLESLHPASAGTDGRQTLLLLLEDVRPGDILEWSYTFEAHPAVMPGHCARFFSPPEGTSLGKLFFSVRFNEARPMKWKSSDSDLAPAESRAKSDVHWVWTRENIPGAIREENTPEWHITGSWIQVSDCADWETVASEFAVAWSADKEDASAKAIAGELAAGPGGIVEHAEKAIHLVQDEYRCLAEDVELQGTPPVALEIVARRRFGNAKDLSFLLVQLLRGLGMSARLVLVNTKLQKSLRDFLPDPGLLDHVVVEFEARGERRWIDATVKGQGGGLLNRVIKDYGAGLPVARVSSGLVSAPAPSIPASTYEIKEAILLDTSGASSLLGIVVTARGKHAEDLHREFESLGIDGVSRQRLQMIGERFGTASRVGPLQYRDDRKANEFFLAEIFEIRDFMRTDAKASGYTLELVDNPLIRLLKLPESTPRRAPFAVPYPCDATHTFEVYCVALAPGVAPEKTVDDPWVQFTLTRKMLAGNWVVQSSLWTLGDAVPAEAIDEYRQSVQEIRIQSGWSLRIPAGLARPHQRNDFGTLPASWESAGAAKRTPLKAIDETNEESTGGEQPGATPSGQPGDIRYKRRKRHRRKRRDKKSALVWGAVLAGVMLVLLIFLIIALARGAEHALPDQQRAMPGEAPPAQQ